MEKKHKEQMMALGIREDTPLAMMTIGQLLNIIYCDTTKFINVAEDVVRKSILDEKLVNLGLSVRAYNLMLAAEIETVGQLCAMKKSNLLRFRNLGRRTFEELNGLLHKLGLEFAPEE